MDSNTVERVRAELLKLAQTEPPAKKKNKFDIVDELYPEIVRLQEQGFTLDAIAGSFSAGGLKINSPTIRSYLTRVKSTSEAKKAPKKKSVKAASATQTVEGV